MGNCQTAEVATVVIQHPGGPPYKAERIYWPISALEVMSSNPGHYVAELTMCRNPNADTPPSQRLQLLRPSDTLLLGSVYRLIPFEDVLKEFASTKKMSVKLGKLVKADRRRQDMGRVDGESDVNPDPISPNSSFGGHGIGSRSGAARLAQWRPALQSIAEVGN